jgi:glycerol-3-phosphate dehydrogenase (NAD(P)+)
MKELSVAVLGGGRWARALIGLLVQNQRKQRGIIKRVSQYVPPRGAVGDRGPMPRPAFRAESDDATMMGAIGPAGMGRARIKAASDDATMMGTLGPASSRGGFKAASDDATMMGAIGPIGGRGALKADSDDATMMGLGSLQASIKQLKAHIKADSDDATMMGGSSSLADQLSARLGGAMRPMRAGSGQKAEAEDATIMSAGSFAALAGPPTAEPLRASLRANAEEATIMSAGSFAGLSMTDDEPDPASIPTELRDVAAADLLILAVPAAAVRSTLRRIAGVLNAQQILVHSVGSLQAGENGQPARLISQIVQEETPISRIGALAGPALAEDLEEWSPAALVCGSGVDGVTAAVRQVLACPTLRIYSSSDLVGVELSRAMSSVVSLASGVCEVLEFGIAARAVLVSRSAAEFARLGLALGARERTFAGLSGVGGLMVASQRRDASDYQLGMQLGSGIDVADALKEIGGTCESVTMIRETQRLAEAHGLRMPILTTLHRWIFGSVELGKAVKDLLDDSNYVE